LYIDSLTKHVTTNIITKTFKCDSCGHFWCPPKACPNCRSPYWDTPRSCETNSTPYGEISEDDGKGNIISDKR